MPDDDYDPSETYIAQAVIPWADDPLPRVLPNTPALAPAYGQWQPIADQEQPPFPIPPQPGQAGGKGDKGDPGSRGSRGSNGPPGSRGSRGTAGSAFFPGGAGGSFLSADGKTITVTNGLVTLIV